MKFSNSFESLLFTAPPYTTGDQDVLLNKDQTEFSIENDAIDVLPNGNAVPMPLPLLLNTISFTSDRELAWLYPN